MAEQVTLDPADKVTFKAPFKDAQISELKIENRWNRSIIFKMKSTRPLRLKMRPVFGLVEPGAVAKVQLTCKSIDTTLRRPSTRDRFTVVTAPAPANCQSAAHAWKTNDTDEVQNHAKRHVLAIVYLAESLASPPSAEPKQSPPAPSVNKAPVTALPVKTNVGAKSAQDEFEDESTSYSDTSSSSGPSDDETDDSLM